MGFNIELIDDRFTDGSLVSLHSRFLDRTLFTIGTFPGPQRALVIRQTPVPPMTCSVSSRLADLLDLSVLLVTPRHFQNALQTHQGERAEASKQPVLTTAPAFTVDAPMFVEPKKGGIRKRLSRRLSRSYMLHLGDDDMLFSTRLFNATPHSSGRSHRRSRT